MLNQKDTTLAKITNISIWFFLFTTAIIILLPIIFMFTSSIMPAIDILKMPYPWITSDFHWQNYWNGLKGTDNSFLFLRNVFNSLFVASIVTTTTILLSVMTGYGLAKFNFKGRNLVFIVFMATMMIPFEVIMIPLYLVIVKMGFIDSYIGLILPFLTTAFGIFLMRQSLITFPDEVLDAARIDGAGELSIFFKVVIPNSKAAIATLAILSFRTQWDSLLWPLLVVQSDRMKTIPLYITKYMAETHTDEGIMMAVAVMASIPIFILFFSMSKYFISSGLHSSTKG